MKINDIHAVTGLLSERRDLESLLTTLSSSDVEKMGQTMSVIVNGKYLDNDCMLQCRQPLIEELKRRIMKCNGKMQALGVTL